MKDKKKHCALAALSEHLRCFIPSITNTYVCPTCLVHVPLSKPDLVSKAHIIPQSAGGGITTWLCRKCNSDFGRRQDKWFGEYLQITKNSLSPFDTPTKAQKFELDGIRFGGTYCTNSVGEIEFVIDPMRTSPASLNELQIRSRSTGFDRSSVSFSVPLLANQDLINPGFLTAAYLLWFRELGYSWVLQAHLSEVRDQIRNPESKILKYRYVFAQRGAFVEKPWIGFLKANEEIYLASAIADRIVVFPAADRLPKSWLDLPTSSTTNYRQLEFFRGANYQGPLGIMYQDRVLVMPDQMLQSELKGVFALYPGWEADPIQMYPIPEGEYKRQASGENVKILKARGRLELPDSNTGVVDE